MRRTPDEARALILDAAERVFATSNPDVAGLKDVAGAAGVSHALVTHYFGTYAALVEAVLERRFTTVRDRLVGEVFASIEASTSAADLLAHYRKALLAGASDPITVRLGAWAMMNGRAGHADFFAHRLQGMRVLVDAMAARTQVPREDLELALVMTFAFGVTWTVGKDWLLAALGKETDREAFAAAFEARAAVLIDSYLQRGRREDREPT